MIGNSLKSDILPLVKLNAHAVHIPFHTTWAHEQVLESETENIQYKTVKSLRKIIEVLN